MSKYFTVWEYIVWNLYRHMLMKYWLVLDQNCQGLDVPSVLIKVYHKTYQWYWGEIFLWDSVCLIFLVTLAVVDHLSLSIMYLRTDITLQRFAKYTVFGILSKWQYVALCSGIKRTAEESSALGWYHSCAFSVTEQRTKPYCIYNAKDMSIYVMK